MNSDHNGSIPTCVKKIVVNAISQPCWEIDFYFVFLFENDQNFLFFFLCKKFFLMFYFVFKNTRNFPEKEIRSQKLRGFWYFEQKENTWYFLKDKKYFIPLNILLLYSHNLESNFGKDYRTNPKILL